MGGREQRGDPRPVRKGAVAEKKRRRYAIRVIGGTGANLGRTLLPGLAREARRILSVAKKQVANYTKLQDPSAMEKTQVAAHALRLAKLDGLYRRGELDVSTGFADEGDIRDLLGLLDIVPFDRLDQHLREGPIFLNPTFGTYSHLVGGADADLLVSGLLLDIKTTKYPDFANRLPQVIGYAILADLHRGEDPSFPEPREVGFYFSRHGVIQSVSYGEIRNHPDFASASDALLQAAKKDYGLRTRVHVAKNARQKPSPARPRGRKGTKRKR